MTALRLIADDLTGALDSAAAFARPDRPIPVRWSAPSAVPEASLAVDSGTREATPHAAEAKVRGLARLFGRGADAIRYKKIDSLLRGNEAEEIGAILDVLRPEACILAPAFPAQNRATRGGRQMFRRPDGEWVPTETDLASRLALAGHAVRRARPGEAPGGGITLFDAGTDADLDRIASTALPSADVLWIGSAGLAAALARRHRTGADRAPPSLRGPVLGLFGTNHEVMRGQLARAAQWHRVVRGDAEEAGSLAHRLREQGALLLSVFVPPGTARGPAAERIADVFGALVRRLDPPGTLLVAGGETLSRLCVALDVEWLDVVGEVLPGVPRSILRGGRWDGTAAVSKSGAFGTADFLSDLVAPTLQGIHA